MAFDPGPYYDVVILIELNRTAGQLPVGHRGKILEPKL